MRSCNFLFTIATVLSAATLFSLAACTQTAHIGPAIPAPTPDRPMAYNYLPAVLGLCSNDEYPFLAALNAQPLETTRPVLETLGIVRDYNLVHYDNGIAVEEGWQNAINSRYRLVQRRAFDTTNGSRIAWVWYRGPSAGNQAQTTDRLFMLTTSDYQIVKIEIARTLAFAQPVFHPGTDSITVDFSRRDVSFSTQISFTPSDIQVVQQTAR